MGKYISIGQFNKYYFFILGSILVKLLNTFIVDYFPSLTPNKPIFLFGFQPFLLSHPFIKYTFQFLGIGLGGLISEFIFNIGSKDIGKKFKEDKDSYLKKIYLVFFLYYFSKLSISSLDSLGFHQVKLWTFEFIPVYFFSQKLLKTKIYKHQKLSLLATLIFTTLLYFINSFIPERDKNCENKENKCGFIHFNVYGKIINKLHWFFIPIIFIIYFLAMASNAYASVRNKWFMDVKYISIYKIITFIGMIGFVFSLIILFIISFISCPKNEMKYICFFKYNGNIYYENFRSIKNIKIDSKFFFEIFILIPIYLVSNFFSFYFDLLPKII